MAFSSFNSFNSFIQFSKNQAIMSGGGVPVNTYMWVAGGNYSGGYTINYSTNGTTWTGRGNSIFSTAGYGIACNGSIWVAVGSGNYNTMAYSIDGTTWNGLGKSIFSTTGYRIVCNGSTWIASSYSYDSLNTLAYSTNGITWTGLGKTIFNVCNTIAWNGYMWIVGGGGDNTLAYSTDGKTWTGLGNSIFTSDCKSIASW